MLKQTIILFWCSTLWAVNQLSVQNPGVYGSRQGYIDQVTLVLEPHGAFVEQSLYLNYSDHHNFPANTQLEVVHRFELPAGSVVNDMWLWIGDSVMQAICLDTWTARAIYDSIVSFKRDPAFLTKNGDQYELHIYPMLTGVSRKIKINFISPTRWQGPVATAVLPLRMLQVNTGLATPLTILFREKSYIWDDPQLLESASSEFKILRDTLGVHYKMTILPDINAFSQLTLKFGVQFPDGFYYQACRFKDHKDYFQIGLLPDQLFRVSSDTSRKKYLIGLDLNPAADENPDQLLTELAVALPQFIKPRDQFNVVMTGAGQFFQLGSEWQNGNPAVIQSAIAKMRASSVLTGLANRRVPHILYADAYSMQCWSFPGIEKLATRESGKDLFSCRSRYSHADVIAAYEHGNEAVPSQQQFNLIVVSLDSFFNRGGRLLSFYDYNRVNKEKLGSYYIRGLTTRAKISDTIFRNVNGYIGSGLPASFHHPVANILEYNDPEVRIEAMDALGRPVIISKKIKNGLLVISGLWSFKDDAAMRSLLATPLLGLNKPPAQQLEQLLDLLAERFQAVYYDQGLIMSYSDSLLLPDPAKSWVDRYLQNLNPTPPVLHTVTLLSGHSYTPASYVENGVAYYGSGFWLKTLSSRTHGIHFERHLCDWNYITGQLASGTDAPTLLRLEVSTTAVPAGSAGIDKRQIGEFSANSRQPVFLIGSVPTGQSLRFNVQAEFLGAVQPQPFDLNLPPAQDSLTAVNVLPAMLANEWIKEKLDLASFDTLNIVNLAKKYHLLCDYTALIALEPNDTLRFMKQPFDESKYPATPVEQETAKVDTFSLEVYPNPFNERTAIQINLAEAAEVGIIIYNLMGQSVREILLPTALFGKHRFAWDGCDDQGRQASSGLYFIRVVLFEKTGSRQIVRRVMMVR